MNTINTKEAFDRNIGIDRLVALLNVLRDPYLGCPWDIAQTHKIVHIDGLVYSPGKAKKKYIKEIECLFSGIKIKQNDL